MKLKKCMQMLVLPLLAACMCSHAASAQSSESLTQYANPLIGTAHCRWFHFAPGALPFGLAKPGAATNASVGNKSGWEATGYDYRDTSIEGFPCLHEFQVGGIVLMPTTGTLVTVPGAVGSHGEGYRSDFSHADEVARPGYYSVLLKDYKITAEVTATKRVAYQRFTFPEGNDSHVLFDIGNRQGESGPVVDAEVAVTPDGLVEGWVETLPAYCEKYQKNATVRMFFSARMDKKPASFGTFVKQNVFAGQAQAKGVGAGAYLTYSTKDKEAVTAQVGLSYTSVENARLNREVETNNGTASADSLISSLPRAA